MDELIVVFASLLIGVTLVSALVYYRQIRKAQKEYEKARGAVEDIILSFNRQFRRENERLEVLGYKVEAAAAKGESALGNLGGLDKKIGALQNMSDVHRQEGGKIMARIDQLEKISRDIAASRETIVSRVVSLEQQAKQLSALPEAVLEGAIPIRRERALAQLTTTEVSVLSVLASEGPKTAPEIKERVGLSREHTARLMKKLYEEGYLERETGKIPFKYSVKKEMEKLLQKAENQTAQGQGELNSSS